MKRGIISIIATVGMLAIAAIPSMAHACYSDSSGTYCIKCSLELEDMGPTSVLYDATVRCKFKEVKYSIEATIDADNDIHTEAQVLDLLFDLYVNGSSTFVKDFSFDEPTVSMGFAIRKDRVYADTAIDVDYGQFSNGEQLISQFTVCDALIDADTNPICIEGENPIQRSMNAGSWQIGGITTHDGKTIAFVMGCVSWLYQTDADNMDINYRGDADSGYETLDHESSNASFMIDDRLCSDKYPHNFIARVTLPEVTSGSALKFSLSAENLESMTVPICGNRHATLLPACNPFSDDISTRVDGDKAFIHIKPQLYIPPKDAGGIHLYRVDRDGEPVKVEGTTTSVYYSTNGYILSIGLDKELISHEELYFIKYHRALSTEFSFCDKLSEDSDEVAECLETDPAQPSDPTPTADGDGDGVDDTHDNCPSVANAAQGDADADGLGDVCDNCPVIDNPGQENFDGDYKGDACDNDDDNDTAIDEDDPCPLDEYDTCSVSSVASETIVDDIAEGYDILPTDAPAVDEADGGNGVVTSSCSMTPNAVGTGNLGLIIFILLALPIMVTRVAILKRKK